MPRRRGAGRPRTRVLVEDDLTAVTVREHVTPEVRACLDRPGSAGTVQAPLLTAAVVEEGGTRITQTFHFSELTTSYEQAVPWPPGRVRVWALMCPVCRHRRRALYFRGQRLACRVCHGLRYQSWSGRWDYPLLAHVLNRVLRLERARGPKGRRHRAAERSCERVGQAFGRSLRGWCTAVEDDAGRGLLGAKAKRAVARARRDRARAV